ncbi:hypothetical protein Tco_1411291, partial [Tanacetum coccineum]
MYEQNWCILSVIAFAGVTTFPATVVENIHNRFPISHIPRVENSKADALGKLVAVQFDHLSKEVLVEKGMLPEDPVDARTLMEKIGNYKMKDGVLYRKSYLVPLMRCVGPFRPIT